jgi:hypothetical protein
VFYDFDFYAGTERLRRQLEEEKRQKAEQERQKAERRAAIDTQLGPAVREAEAGVPGALVRVCELIEAKHGIRVECRTDIPGDAYAYADWSRRTIVLPPGDDDENCAVRLHEDGHIIAGQCTGREPHRPDPSVTRWHHCIACETEAWRIAMTLVPFSREMHARLRRSLQSYRRKTPASPEALKQLDQVAGTVAWATERHKRKRWQMLTERQAAAQASLERDLAPRRRFEEKVTRLERARKGL